MLRALLVFFVFAGLLVTSAQAEEGIYHARSGCQPLQTYQMPEGIAMRDGEGVAGKKVAPADLNAASTPWLDTQKVTIPLEIPSGTYLNADKHQVDLSQSKIALGTLRVGADGSASLNNHPIVPQAVLPQGCAP